MTDAADIQIRASLIDDYLQLEVPPLATNLGGCFVAIQDPATPEDCSLAAIDPNGNLVHFRPDTSSHSGWSLTTIPVAPPPGTSGNPTRLAAYSQGGVINLLVYFAVPTGGSGAVWMQSNSPGVWSKASLSHDSANALAYTDATDTYVDAQGNQYLYGVSANFSPPVFFLVTYSDEGQCWGVVHEQFLRTFSPALSNQAVFRLMPGMGGDGFTVLAVDAGVLHYWGANVVDGSFQWTGTAGKVPLAAGLAVRQIIPMSGLAAANSLLILDQQGGLWLVAGYADGTPSVTQLSGGSGAPAGVLSAALGVGGGAMLMLFAIESGSQTLWILRQIGSTGAGTPTFGTWVQLGNALAALACPADMRGNAAECFAVDLGQTLYHFAQTAGDLVWNPRPIAAPTPSTSTPQNIAATTMNLTVLTAGAGTLGGAVVTVSADQATTILISDLAYQIGPGAPATVEADPAGNLCALIATSGLKAPVLTFSVTNADGTCIQRWCQGDVVEVKAGETAPAPCPQSVASRLANQDPTQPLTAASLQAAGLIAGSYADPDAAAQSIACAGQWMQQNPQSHPNRLQLERVRVRHWRIDFTAPAGPRFERLSQEQGLALLAAAGPPAALGSGGGILGDILNRFRHLWNDLESVAATVANGVLNLIVNGESYVVGSLRQAADALETLFNRVIQGLKDVWHAILDVIDWLKQLFDWGDIVTAHRLIKVCVNSLLDAAVINIDDLGALLQEKFAGLETQIQDGFANLEQVFAPGKSFNDFANALKPNVAGGTSDYLAGAPVGIAYGQHAARCNYVSDKAKTYFSGAAAAAALGGGVQGGDTDAILSLVSQYWAGSVFNTQTQALQADITNKLSDPRDFFDLVIVDLLQLLEDAVLFALDGLAVIALAVLDATVAAIQGLQEIWSASIDIPVLSWLYKYVITGSESQPGDDLTLLDLLSLTIATPATILYKLLLNGKAPFDANDPAVQQLLDSGLPWPAVPGASSAAGTRGDQVARVAAMSPALMEAMAGFAGMLVFVGTPINWTNDMLAMDPDPPPGLVRLMSWVSLIQGVAFQSFAAPWTLLTEESSSWSVADCWTTGIWAAAMVPLAYDTVFSFATGGLARYAATLGPVLDTCTGSALCGLSVVVAVKQGQQGRPYTPWDQINDVVPQLLRIFKFLILVGKAEPELAGALMFLLDCVLGLGATVTQFGTLADFD